MNTVEQIAAEHEAIFDRLHAIYRRLTQQPVEPFDDVITALQALGEELVTHFRTEEDFMRLTGYPGSEDHFSDHASLARLLDRLTNAAASGNGQAVVTDLPLVIHAILQHLCSEDRDMDGFLQRLHPEPIA